MPNYGTEYLRQALPHRSCDIWQMRVERQSSWKLVWSSSKGQRALSPLEKSEARPHSMMSRASKRLLEFDQSHPLSYDARDASSVRRWGKRAMPLRRKPTTYLGPKCGRTIVPFTWTLKESLQRLELDITKQFSLYCGLHTIVKTTIKRQETCCILERSRGRRQPLRW